MCIYKLCRYGCLTKEEHHSRYARMRSNTKLIIDIKKSSKINWIMVEELGLNKPFIRVKKANYEEEILEE
jgi:hypothetical protein